MKTLDLIPTYDESKLATFETNARRWLASGTAAQKAEAEAVLLAIRVERQRRKDDAANARQRRGAEIAEKVRDKGLYDRVILAFTEMPPQDWEVEVLRAVAEHPGADFDTLARAIGKQGGGYINLAMGTVCSERQPYLGIAPPSGRRTGKIIHSELLIDFDHHAESDGRQWHGWTLKPEAVAALREVGILP